MCFYVVHVWRYGAASVHRTRAMHNRKSRHTGSTISTKLLYVACWLPLAEHVLCVCVSFCKYAFCGLDCVRCNVGFRVNRHRTTKSGPRSAYTPSSSSANAADSAQIMRSRAHLRRKAAAPPRHFDVGRRSAMPRAGV